jgi:hypothetical protein
MARTTRSQKLSDDSSNGFATSHPVSSQSKSKSPTRKRKRTSLAPPEDQPSAKQSRNGSAADREDGDEQPQLNPDSVNHASPHTQSTGDLPLDPHVAQQILDILEMSVPCSFIWDREHSSYHLRTGLTPRASLIASSPSPLVLPALQLWPIHNHLLSRRVTHFVPC